MERLGDEVRRSLRGAGVPDAGLLAEITRAWPDAVGPGIAAAAWPARVSRDGTLHVATTSAVWAFELGRMEDDIRGRLAERLPAADLPRLRFAAGHVPAAGAPEVAEQPATRVESSPEAAAAATRLSAPVEDERLRELVRRAVAASLSAPPGDRPF
jgi:hypothetical protein